MIDVIAYPEDLTDIDQGDVLVDVEVPASWCVVMGANGKPEQEVFEERLKLDGVPLLKRRGGGGTVLLGPNILVVTIRAWVNHTFKNLAYFAAINQSLIGVMSQWTDCEFSQRGISDIAVADRKVVGSSIFRRRHLLVYQASILLDLDVQKIDRYLRHPPKEPDYRQGRSHAEFVTCLRAVGIETDAEELKRELKVGLLAPLKLELCRVDQAV